MPTNRYRRARQRRPGMERSQNADWVMLFGDDIMGVFQGDVAAMETYWREFGEAITAEQTVERPGERCWAWWVWSCPRKPRPIVNPAPPDQELMWKDEMTFDGRSIQFGNILHGHQFRGGEWTTHLEPGLHPWLEPEPDYLARLRLMSKDEAAALKVKQAEPPYEQYDYLKERQHRAETSNGHHANGNGIH